MDINHARFVFEVQRVHERVSGACCNSPACHEHVNRTPPAQRIQPWSVRQATAVTLRRLAVWVDVHEAQPISN